MTYSGRGRKRRRERHRCRRCGRPALYRSPSSGKLKARKDHTLCQRCFREDCDRERARKIAAQERCRQREAANDNLPDGTEDRLASNG